MANQPVRVAIVGSRTYAAPERIRAFIDTLALGSVVISGHGGMVDFHEDKG